MASIRTSKTRAKLLDSNRSEVTKEAVGRMRERHGVHSATTALDIHEVERVLDSGGTRVRDMMQEKSAKNEEKARKHFLERHKDTVANMDAVHRRKQEEKHSKGGKNV